ncbi:hypothetical protein Zm00014a_013982 [Zea mays]|uniref:Uncharacterized protein n=1 Tax=Zea mays TaxID=4577 RepID=A0A3L6ER87_MAIZE|nr:hypothetical protein Zm00014a_013982 [Zea mays]
MLIDVDVVL